MVKKILKTSIFPNQCCHSSFCKIIFLKAILQNRTFFRDNFHYLKKSICWKIASPRKQIIAKVAFNIRCFFLLELKMMFYSNKVYFVLKPFMFKTYVVVLSITTHCDKHLWQSICSDKNGDTSQNTFLIFWY